MVSTKNFDVQRRNARKRFVAPKNRADKGDIIFITININKCFYMRVID